MSRHLGRVGPHLSRAALTSLVPLALLLLSGSAQPAAPRQEPAGKLLVDRTTWDRIRNLKDQGQHMQAIHELNLLVSLPSLPDSTARLARHHLIHTHLLRADWDVALRSAREALRAYPDLRATEPEFPPALNELYDSLRRSDLGSLAVRAPAGAKVYLDSRHAGEAPLVIEGVTAGMHDIWIAMPGRRDHYGAVRVMPDSLVTVTVELGRKRGTGWWLTRLGPAAAAGLVLGLVSGGGGGGEDAGPPLPGPPPPPPGN